MSRKTAVRSWRKRLKKAIRRKPQLKIIFIGLPCLGVIAAAMLLILPAIRAGVSEYVPAEASAAAVQAEAPAETVVLPEKPAESEKPDIPCNICVRSFKSDMFVQICDSEGDPINDVFALSLVHPNGVKTRLETEKDGSQYISGLGAGEYSVVFEDNPGYISADTVVFTVKGKLPYKKIVNISEQLDIKTSDEINEQTETEKDVEPTFFAEEVRQPEEPVEVALIDVNVLDENGNQLYTYTYSVGESGALLLAETGEESDVFPIEEEGRLAYGLRRVIRVFYTDGTIGDVIPDETVPPETYTLEESSEYVSLFNDDNTPNGIYLINAEPVIEQQQVMSGWATIDGKIYFYDKHGKAVTGLKSIDGKMYFFDVDGSRASAVGVDVSSFNHDINWGLVKSAGIDFAIIRVGGRSWRNPGDLYDDVKFADNIRQAKAAGLSVGVYFYSMAVDTDEAVEEASLVLERLDGMALELPIFIDVEYSGATPPARADSNTDDMRNEIIRAFCTTVQDSGYMPGYYSGQSFMTHHIYMDQLTDYTVWMASYTETGRRPASFTNHYDIWQMTDSGFVNGINGCVDIDVLW